MVRPGRIKRDLIPNQTKGLPIEEGKQYEIRVSKNLKDADGMSLMNPYSKMIYVFGRDIHSPKIDDWNIQTPPAGTKKALIIDFKEPLDAILTLEAFQINTQEQRPITGTFELNQNENQLSFSPDNPWVKGNYTITVDSILEDLAGNNLNRLFDENLSLKTTNKTTSNVYRLKFIVDF